MATTNKENVIKNISDAITKIDSKDFYMNFFVFDTSGSPNGSLNYIYNLALAMRKMGYKVRMLHAEKDFFGVETWMGEEYAKLPHFNIEKDGVTMSPSDFLFIPELYSNVMYKVKNLPCKKIAILSNYNYLTEIIQPGATWLDYNITECITISDVMKKRILEVFPFLKVEVVPPFVPTSFNDNNAPKKLIVNVINNANKVVKPMFWKFPIFKWVSFRVLNNISQEDLASELKDSFCTVWTDPDTNFGMCALEAMAAGNIVIGKVPETLPEWFMEGDEYTNAGLWFNNTDDCHNLIAWAIERFIGCEDLSKITDKAKEVAGRYTYEKFAEALLAVVNKYVSVRKDEFNEYIKIAKDKLN